MRALCAWAAGLAVVGTTATSASGVVEITTIGSRGRTSLVLLSERPVQSTSLAQKNGRTFLLSGALNGPCEQLRLRSIDPAALVASVTFDCRMPHDFVATIVTRSDVNAAVRTANRRVYVDLTPAAGAAAKIAQAPSAGRPAPATPSSAVTSPDVYSRAQALAATGNVRDLATLMAHLTPAQRRDEKLMGSLDALVEAARQRRLELDRALFTNGTPGDRP